MVRSNSQTLPIRPANEVMKLNRLGVFRQTSISFLRTLLRKMMREDWQIKNRIFSLDENGYGHAVYTIYTPKDVFSFTVVTNEMLDENRSDRVISTEWDVTFALSEGIIKEDKISSLREELPKQEAGRANAFDIVWSRANKSNRVFSYVVDCLKEGKQPDPEIVNEVGYLLRTTAVYGNGKFGLGLYNKIKEEHPFSGPFCAQMFAVYLLRHFSFELVEHIAKVQSEVAVPMDSEVKRYIGTGNATGLGMAPFLIAHPRLIHQWIYMREKAIARAKSINPSIEELQLAVMWIYRISDYLNQTNLIDRGLLKKDEDLAEEMTIVRNWIQEYMEKQTMNGETVDNIWFKLAELTKEHISIEMEEIFNTIILEIYTDHITEFENYMDVIEDYKVNPLMTLEELRSIIRTQYRWALQYDFTDPNEKYYFWYRSMEKEEPRLGVRGLDPGEEWELPLNIAEQVQQLEEGLQNESPQRVVSSFILENPRFKGIIQRIQSLEGYEYAEIQENLLSKELYPLHLLRCKLSFFGAERFNPKSDKWVRITLFQGAPLVEEIGKTYLDHWVFPSLPI